MRTALLIPILALAGTINAQQPQQPVRIDPGYSDVSPVAISQRKVELDQRIPSSFDGVYEFSKADAFGRGQNMFMRIDGAVTAVFPKSVYIPTQFGAIPDIPPGTIFHIGPIPQTRQTRREREAQDRPETYINTSVAAAPHVEARPDPVVSIPSIIADEVYRQKRVAALLARAAGE